MLCPMLPGAPGHELWRRDFTGGCGLFSFVLKGGDAGRAARASSTRSSCSGSAIQWGGYESLVIPFDPGARPHAPRRGRPPAGTRRTASGCACRSGSRIPDDLIARPRARLCGDGAHERARQRRRRNPRQRRARQRPVGRRSTRSTAGASTSPTRAISVWTRAGRDRGRRRSRWCSARLGDPRSPAGCSAGSPARHRRSGCSAQKLISIAIWVVDVPDRRSTSSAST